MSRSYKVIAADMTSPTTLVLTMFCVDKRKPITYRPGQYATISFHRHGRPTPARCFSVTSTPADKGWLQFGLRVAGNFTQAAAHNIKPGDVVTIDGGFGSFVLSPTRDRTVVFLAGGIGITPFMSLVRHAAKAGLSNDILLIYSSNNQNDVPFANELMSLEQQNPRFHVVFAISKGPLDRFAGHRAVSGRVTPELLDGMLANYYREKTYFLCGPGPFMEAMTAHLRSRKVPRVRIVTEEFTRGIPADTTWLGQPSQIYALTAVSMLLGTGMVIDHDFLAAAAKSQGTAEKSTVATTGTMETSQREGAIDQTIGDLVTVNGDSGATSPSGTGSSDAVGGSSGDGSSGSTSEGGSGVVRTNPSPTPTPTPVGKSPTPTPTPTPPTTHPTPTPTPTSPTPTPTPTPAAVPPSLSLGASSTSITKGASVTLSWGINAGATSPVSCSASGGWSGAKATSGSQAVAPSSTTTYTLSCSNSGGSSTKSVTVVVSTPTPPPPPPTPPPTPPPSSGGS